MLARMTTLLGLIIACVACSLKAESPPAQESISRNLMKAVLTVSGGVTGIGGKWEVDLASDETKRGIASDQLGLLKQLVAEAHKADVFGQDFSAAPSTSATGRNSPPVTAARS